MRSPKIGLMLRSLLPQCGRSNGVFPRKRAASGAIVLLLMVLIFGEPARAQQGTSIVGRWHSKDAVQEITADFGADGSFYQVVNSAYGRVESRGRYRLTGQVLVIEIQGALQPLQSQCRFTDADTFVLTYPTGEVIRAQRVKSEAATKPTAPAQPPASTTQRPA